LSDNGGIIDPRINAGTKLFTFEQHFHDLDRINDDVDFAVNEWEDRKKA
jgi:hypothetical protein